MKKTLITLLIPAMLVTAWANEELTETEVTNVKGDWTVNFTTSDTTITQTVSSYTAAWADDESPLSIELTGLTTTGNGGSGYSSTSQAYESVIRPNTNVGNGGTWTLTFTLTNTSATLLDVKAITLGTFAYNSGGAAQSADTYSRNILFTLAEGSTTLATESHDFGNSSNGWDSATTIELGDNYFSLKANESITLTLTVSEVESQGTFIGLKNATFKVIPEPATATLSLLALAGLAVRRRRK